MEEKKPVIKAKPGGAPGRLGGLASGPGGAAPAAAAPAPAPATAHEPPAGGDGAAPAPKKMNFRPNTQVKRKVMEAKPDVNPADLTNRQADSDLFQSLIKKAQQTEKPGAARGQPGVATGRMQQQRSRVAFDGGQEAKGSTRRAASSSAKREADGAGPSGTGKPGSTTAKRRLKKLADLQKAAAEGKPGAAAAAAAVQAAVAQDEYLTDDSDADENSHLFDAHQDIPITLPMRNWAREDAAWDDDPEETPFIENFAVRETDPPDNVAHRLGLLKVEGDEGPRLEDWEDDAEDREEGDGCHLLLMQLPLLPLSVLRPGATVDPEADPSAARAASVREMPPGRLGKLLVLEDGEVRMQIGDHIFNVDLGAPCQSRHELVAINVQQESCAHLGQLWRRVVVTPDVDGLLAQVDGLGLGKADAAAGPSSGPPASTVPRPGSGYGTGAGPSKPASAQPPSEAKPSVVPASARVPAAAAGGRTNGRHELEDSDVVPVSDGGDAVTVDGTGAEESPTGATGEVDVDMDDGPGSGTPDMDDD